MKFFQSLGVLGALIFLALWVGGIVGWILNIFAILHGVSGPLTTLFVLRIVGIFAFPLGAILGYVG
jgi:hypothetical protein